MYYISSSKDNESYMYFHVHSRAYTFMRLSTGYGQKPICWSGVNSLLTNKPLGCLIGGLPCLPC